MLVDCGDFGSSKSKSQKLKVEYLLKGMSLLNYTAINLSEKDLQYGQDYLKEMREKYNLPFISANVFYAETNELFAKPYIIKEIGGKKIGIFGVTQAVGVKRFVTPESGFKIKDPILAAKAAVDYLHRECDVVIALSHLAVKGSTDLAKQVEGIDIIISGHNGGHLRAPQQEGQTVIMQPGSQGKYLGHLDFRVTSKTVSILQGKTVDLDSNIPDDTAFTDLVKEYEDALIATYPMESSQAQLSYSQFSYKSCMACHLKETNQWRTTRHSHAWQTLVEQKQNNDSECQECHTTLFEESNGFTTISKNPDLVNVQCSECHRLAVADIQIHNKRTRTRESSTNGPTNGKDKVDFKAVSEQTCLKCHDEDRSPDFNYQGYLSKISH